MVARTVMNMGLRRTIMHTDVLTLTQLLSPSFPVGAFAYSHGLEKAIEARRIADAQSLQNWLSDLMIHGGARSDAVLLAAAFAALDVAEVDAEARAFASSAERLRETDLQGAAFCNTVHEVWDLDISGLTYPVAVGHTAALLGLDVELTLSMYLQAFVGNLTAAAMRLVPLGQLDGQRVQLALKPACEALAAECASATLDDLASNAWMSDICAMQHETQYARVFRT